MPEGLIGVVLVVSIISFILGYLAGSTRNTKDLLPDKPTGFSSLRFKCCGHCILPTGEYNTGHDALGFDNHTVPCNEKGFCRGKVSVNLL